MWNDISDERSLNTFMSMIGHFHDGCIKEIKYLSGAYVGEDLAMYPINDKRVLKVIIQRQYRDIPVVELEFEGLKYLRLFADDEGYTCEILDSTIILKDGLVYWCDCGDLTEADLESYDGTVICASKLRWRSVENGLGNEEMYVSRV